MTYNRKPDALRQTFAKLYKTNKLTYDEIAAALETSRRVLFYWRDQLGLPRRKQCKGVES